MKLPHPEQAVVEREKIVDYLLNDRHPDNGGKAAFFENVGFRREEWNVLAAALLMLAQTAEVSQRVLSPHGAKYVIVGPLQAPGGHTAMVLTVWIIDKGLEAARLVTAYPWKARVADGQGT